MLGVIEFATEILASVRTFLGPSVAARERRRSDDAALVHRINELQLEHDAAQITERERDYPLGTSRRLRRRRRPGLAPCLIVSPIEWQDGRVDDVVAHTISDHLAAVDPSGTFLQVMTGGFARDGRQLRTIEGGVRAAEIAELEFSPAPSLIVYFERSAGALLAKMLLTHVIPTIDGAKSLTMPLARLGNDGLYFAMWGEPGVHEVDLEWIFEPIDAKRDSGPAALGSAVAGFAGAVASIYWQLQGVRWRVNRPGESMGLESGFEGLLGLPVDSDDDQHDAFLERLEQEFAGLIAAGLSPELSALPDDGVGLYIDLVASSILFVLGDSYPQEPPQVFLRDAGGDVELITLDRSQWKPSNSIVELANALR